MTDEEKFHNYNSPPVEGKAIPGRENWSKAGEKKVHGQERCQLAGQCLPPDRTFLEMSQLILKKNPARSEISPILWRQKLAKIGYLPNGTNEKLGPSFQS